MACSWIRIQPKHRPFRDRQCCCGSLQWEHEAMVGASNDQVPAILDQVYQVWSPLHPWMQLEWVDSRAEKLTDEEEPVGQKCSTTMSLRCVLWLSKVVLPEALDCFPPLPSPPLPWKFTGWCFFIQSLVMCSYILTSKLAGEKLIECAYAPGVACCLEVCLENWVLRNWIVFCIRWYKVGVQAKAKGMNQMDYRVNPESWPM